MQSRPGVDSGYLENVIMPYLVTRTYQGETLSLPMIDVKFTKENAQPRYLWGLLTDSWKPCAEDGVTLFLQGLENRGEDNRRKRIYMSALTPDLYRQMYSEKVTHFFEKLLDKRNAGKPVMRHYMQCYPDMYWDLHLGVNGDAIPAEVRQMTESINTVIAYLDPTQGIVYENYMKVRAVRSFVRRWIEEKIADVIDGRIANAEKTFTHYWMKNGFEREDVVAECIHDHFAFAQWGKTIYNIMLKLDKKTGDSDVLVWFRKAMQSDVSQTDGSAFTRLERFVMELFRTISPNAGSESAMEEVAKPAYERYGYVVVPHLATSLDPRHWENPDQFDPDRYKSVPTSHEIDEGKCQQIGFAKCPFDNKTFGVKDGRSVELHNSGFGTVYCIVDGETRAVCDYAGYAPFGFGYRRCPAEQFTIQAFSDVLTIVWSSKIQFEKLDTADPELLPIGPGAVVADNVGFTSLI